MRTVGVEEELLLVDAHHEVPAPAATRVLQIASVQGNAAVPGEDGDAPDAPDATAAFHGALVYELQEQQVELYTAPHGSMATLEDELRGLRAQAAAAAQEAGVRVVASATSPVPVDTRLVHTPRYTEMARRFGITASEHLTCGCHVHVSVASDEEAVGVLDRIRVWLPALLALSANSPFWNGHDTGYASYRSQSLGSWPVSGPPEIFGTAERYHDAIGGMIASHVLLDEGMVYLQARCSHRFPTVEIRVADVCPDVRDAVLVAALCRGLVETAAGEWAAGEPPPPVPTALLRLATWQAARWGICDRLLDPVTSRPRPAGDVIADLLAHVSAALTRCGDEELVTERVQRILRRGNGACRQREVFRRSGRLDDVVSALARVTVDRDD